MLYPEMRPVEKTPSVGRPTKPKPAPVSPPPPPAQAPPGKDASGRRNHDDSGRDDSNDKGDRQEPPASQPVKVEYAPDIVWSPEGLAASGHVTFLPHGSDEAPSGITVWQEHTPLSPGQEQHVNHLLHVETDILAREVLITIQRDGLPPRGQWSHFMSQYALWSWDSESDAFAWATLVKIEQSDWDEMLGFADEEAVETVAQDLGNNTREGLVIIDADSGETLLERTGVLREDGGQHVGLQDAEVEALRGRRLIFVHNHPNGTGASAADRVSAFAAGAELLLVITGDGREEVYLRGRDRMALVRDGQASYELGSPMLNETIALAKKSAEEARRYREDRPELVFWQAEPGIQIEVTGSVQFDANEAALVLDEGAHGSRADIESLFTVVGKSRFNPYVVLVVDANGREIWIDLKVNGGAAYAIKEAENLAGIPYADESEAITENPYTRTILGLADFLPIAQENIAGRGVIAFGAEGNDAWRSTHGHHPGFDIFAEAGAEVRAIASGEVVGISVPGDVNYDHVYGLSVRSNTAYPRDPEPESKIYAPQSVSTRARQWFADDWIVERGHRAYVIIRSGNAYIVYGHLDPHSIQVGTHVLKGQTIGAVGEDPHAGNDHLHFELKTHGWLSIPLDESDEYVAKSRDHRPQIFLNPLYLFSEETRERIIAKYDMAPLTDQHLAITGSKPIKDHNYDVEYFWRNRTGVIREDGGS